MKTDSIFYRLFQEFPEFFFELIGSSPKRAASYEFASREVKQLAFRMDGLFIPTTDAPNQPFYLVEVQFQPDKTLYYRIFGEMFLYLRQYRLSHPWQVVVIYPSRAVEREEKIHFSEILNLNRVRRIYLDELGSETDTSLGVEVVKLIIEPEQTVGEKALAIVEQAKQQLSDDAVKRNLINLIETIIVYKLPHKSWEEVKAMFGLNELKQTKVYQEAYQEAYQEVYQEAYQEASQEVSQQVSLETKLNSVQRMLRLGLSQEIIAQSLDLPLEIVKQEAQKSELR